MTEEFLQPGAVIEFAGLPGSGKTTLHQGLVSLLIAHERQLYEKPDVPTVGKLRRGYRKFSTIAMRPGLFLRAITVLGWSRRSWAHKSFATRAFLATLQLYRDWAASDSDDVLVMDEGMVQRAFLLFVDIGRPVSYRRLCRYADTIPVPDLLVYVELDPAEACRRQLAKLEGPRGPGWLPNRLLVTDREQLLDTFIVAQKMFESLTAILRERGCRVVRIQAADMQGAVEDLVAAIVPLLSKPDEEYI